MVGIDTLSLEEQNWRDGMCLECHTQILVKDPEMKKRLRERLYQPVPNKYCGQCQDQLSIKIESEHAKAEVYPAQKR